MVTSIAAARKRLTGVCVRLGARECLRCHPPFGGGFEAVRAECLALGLVQAPGYDDCLDGAPQAGLGKASA